MRYLKRYNESIITEVDEVIKDICLELEDNDFNTEISAITDPGLLSYAGSVPLDLSILIIKKNSYHNITGREVKRMFNMEDIEEVSNRIKDYLGDKFISLFCTRLNGSSDVITACKIIYKNR